MNALRSFFKFIFFRLINVAPMFISDPRVHTYANFKQIILSDFEGPKPPTFCGVDVTTGDDKFCCIGLDKTETETKPQLPQFPVSGTVSKPRPCIDHTSICPQWLQAQYIF